MATNVQPCSRRSAAAVVDEQAAGLAVPLRARLETPGL
jgi:hypothetical protein